MLDAVKVRRNAPRRTAVFVALLGASSVLHTLTLRHFVKLGAFTSTDLLGDLVVVAPEPKTTPESKVRIITSSWERSPEPPSTPSGWWPDDDWLQQCADEQAKLPARPFPSSGVWERYRLGDCIKLCRMCGNLLDSLAVEYKKRACNGNHPADAHVHGGNITIIEEILNLRNGVEGFIRPAEDELVIHLRLGDVIEHSEDDVATMLSSGGNPKHSAMFASGINSVYEYLSDIQESGVSRVRMVGGSHHPNMCLKSRPYADCLQQSIARAGYSVEMELDSGNPDQDFYFMAHANKIVVSAGGFSSLLGDLAVYKGGQTIGRTFLTAGWSATNTSSSSTINTESKS